MKLSLEISHKKQLKSHVGLFLIFFNLFFIYIYKMERKSLKSICEKVIFSNINTKKIKDLPKKGLKERTLSTVVKKYKEKMRDKRGEYSFFLKFLKEQSYFYDDCWRYCIFCFTKEKDKKIMLKNDKKIRDEMIKNEIKTKKYLIKNDFDVLEGFREFLFELNKSLIFKLSEKYERNTLVRLMKMNEDMEGYKMFLNRANRIWLQKTLIKNFIDVCGLENISSLELDRAIKIFF